MDIGSRCAFARLGGREGSGVSRFPTRRHVKAKVAAEFTQILIAGAIGGPHWAGVRQIVPPRPGWTRQVGQVATVECDLKGHAISRQAPFNLCDGGPRDLSWNSSCMSGGAAMRPMCSEPQVPWACTVTTDHDVQPNGPGPGSLPHQAGGAMRPAVGRPESGCACRSFLGGVGERGRRTPQLPSPGAPSTC